MRTQTAASLLAVLVLTALPTPWVFAEAKVTAAEEEIAAPARLLMKLWHKPGAFTSVKHVALQSDQLYLAGTPRGLEAIDLKTGLPRWMHPGRYPVDRIPTEREEVVYVAEGGQIVTLKRATGEEIARTRTRVGFKTPIYPGDSSWVVGGTDDHVIGIAPNEGFRAWRITLDDSIVASTWDGNRMAYFTTMQGSLYGVSIPTREQAWTYKFGKPACSPPVLSGRMLFVGSEDYYLYAFDAVSGARTWKLVVSAPALDAPLPAGKRVYVPTRDGLVHAIDPSVPTDLWTIKASRVLTTTADHVIYLRKEGDTNIIGIADTNGKVLGEANALKYRNFAASPETGVFYAIAPDGEVLAMGDRAAIEARRAQEEAAREAEALAPKPAPVPAPAPRK